MAPAPGDNPSYFLTGQTIAVGYGSQWTVPQTLDPSSLK
jgi:hypothetical protein